MVSGDERINKSNHKGTKKNHSKKPPMYLFHHSVDVTYSFRLVISFILSALYGYIVQFSCLFVSDSLRSNVCQGSLSITNSRSPPKPMSIESMMPSNHLILCCPLLLLPSIFPSVRVFSNESALCIRWPKYWSFSFNISPSN